jgi:hypothetical protein
MPDDITKRIANFIEPFRVTPGSSVTLAKDFDAIYQQRTTREIPVVVLSPAS